MSSERSGTPTVAAAPPPARAAVPAKGISRDAWALGTLLVVAVLYAAAPLTSSQRVLLGNALLLAAPLAAAASLFAAARRAAPGGARTSWILLGTGALSALAGQLFWSAEQVMGGQAVAFPSPAYYLFLGLYALFSAGAIAALRPTGAQNFSTASALDSALLVTAAAFASLRLGIEPALGLTSDPAQIVALLAGQLAAVSALFFAGLLLLWRDVHLPDRSVAALVSAVLTFALGAALSAGGWDPDPGRAGGLFDLVWLSGWTLFILAGLAGAERADRPGERAARGVTERLRQGIAPGAVVFLGLAGMEVAFWPGASWAGGVALAVMGVLLGIRTAHAIRSSERQQEAREQLAQTRALVEVSHALAYSTELNNTLSLVVDWTRRLLQARAAGLELLTEDGRTLEFRAASGFPPDVVGMRFPVDDSFTGWVVRHGRPRATADPATDPFMQPQSLPLLGHSPTIAAALRYRDQPLGALSCIRDRPFGAADLELLGALADQAAIAIENARLFEQVRTLSLTDPLTGLANRRQLERDLAREFAAAKRGRRIVAVMFDLDGFKQYNDTHGHLAGDHALEAFAAILAGETRAMNLAARYGGDEFVVLLADSEFAGAGFFVERVRERFAQEERELRRGGLTVSAGIAAFDPGMQRPQDLIAAADRALYEEKARRSST